MSELETKEEAAKARARAARLRVGDYPLGTKVHAWGGGYWLRVKSGWQANGGDTFPMYGADASWVELPAPSSEGSEKPVGDDETCTGCHGSGWDGMSERFCTCDDGAKAKSATLTPVSDPKDLETELREAPFTIYTASKTAHAHRWRELREQGWPVIATWIDEAGVGETDCFTDLWTRCVGEASRASAVLLYREPGEVLKGAFVEAGAALSNGKPVHAIGCGDFSFVNHPLVTQHETIADALRTLNPKGGDSDV